MPNIVFSIFFTGSLYLKERKNMGKGKGKKGKNADPQEPPHDPGWERVRFPVDLMLRNPAQHRETCFGEANVPKHTRRLLKFFSLPSLTLPLECLCLTSPHSNSPSRASLSTGGGEWEMGPPRRGSA